MFLLQICLINDDSAETCDEIIVRQSSQIPKLQQEWKFRVRVRFKVTLKLTEKPISTERLIYSKNSVRLLQEFIWKNPTSHRTTRQSESNPRITDSQTCGRSDCGIGPRAQGPLSPKGNDWLNVCCVVCPKVRVRDSNPRVRVNTELWSVLLGIVALGDSGPWGQWPLGIANRNHIVDR